MGIAIVARTAMMPSTNIVSISVNPELRRSRFIRPGYGQGQCLSGGRQKRQSHRLLARIGAASAVMAGRFRCVVLQIWSGGRRPVFGGPDDADSQAAAYPDDRA